MKLRKLPPIKEGELHIGCLNCSTSKYEADMDDGIISSGDAYCFMDGKLVFDGNKIYEEEERVPTFKDAENLAEKDPNHDWRVVIYSAMHGETYQRHGKEKWVCVDSNKGYA